MNRQFYDFADVSKTVAYKICAKAVCRNTGGFLCGKEHII